MFRAVLIHKSLEHTPGKGYTRETQAEPLVLATRAKQPARQR